MSNDKMTSRLQPYLWDLPPQKWTPDTDDVLVCCGVRPETHDVRTFLFRTRSPRFFRFKPGQFITLELLIDGETINRCYTVSSPPTRPDTLTITVKRKPGGKVSNWLHDNLRAGMEVKALGPAGDFTCADHPAEKYLFLSGGSGVTPLMSMTRSHYELGEDRDILFVHSARSPRDIIFLRELAMMESGARHLRTAFVCEQGADGWSGPVGFLTFDVLKDVAPDFANREIFCCGPDPYMKAVRAMLEAAGFDMQRYHQESFTFGEEEPATTSVTATAPEPASVVEGAFNIEYTLSGQSIACPPDQFILAAARAAGMRLPFSCTKGLCGTCKTKKLSGEVAMKHGGGIRQREIDQGFILPCCSKPLSDVVLEK